MLQRLRSTFRPWHPRARSQPGRETRGTCWSRRAASDSRRGPRRRSGRGRGTRRRVPPPPAMGAGLVPGRRLAAGRGWIGGRGGGPGRRLPDARLAINASLGPRGIRRQGRCVWREGRRGHEREVTSARPILRRLISFGPRSATKPDVLASLRGGAEPRACRRAPHAAVRPRVEAQRCSRARCRFPPGRYRLPRQPRPPRRCAAHGGRRTSEPASAVPVGRE